MPFPSVLPQARVGDPRAVPALRWGIQGPGWIAERFVAALREHTDQQVVAVQSRALDRAQIFATRRGIDKTYAGGDMLDDAGIDVVYVATPHNHHYPDALAAIEAGKHVLVEKPLALNAREAAALAAAAKRKGVVLMEAYWSDFLPKFDVIRQLLDDGVLGTIHTVLADHGEHFGPEHRIMRTDLAGGPLLDLGTYPVALATGILGAPTTVQATGQGAPSGVNGQAAMLLTHEGGAQSALHCSILTHTPCVATIAGDRGFLSLPRKFYEPGPFTLTANDMSMQVTYDEPRAGYGQLHHEAVHFAACVGEGRPESPLRPLARSLVTIETIDQVREQLGIVFNEERTGRQAADPFAARDIGASIAAAARCQRRGHAAGRPSMPAIDRGSIPWPDSAGEPRPPSPRPPRFACGRPGSTTTTG